MSQTDKCEVAQGLKVVLIISLIIINHSRMIQALRFIEISKYDDDDGLPLYGGHFSGKTSKIDHTNHINMLYLNAGIEIQ